MSNSMRPIDYGASETYELLKRPGRPAGRDAAFKACSGKIKQSRYDGAKLRELRKQRGVGKRHD